MSAPQETRRTGDPTPERPHMAPGYGLPEHWSAAQAPAWRDVVAQVARARNYWVGTTRPDGRPHAMPVWGVWVDDTLLFSTDPRSRKGRNLAASPAVVVHLESGDEVVIVEGLVEPVTDEGVLARYVDAYDAKYQFRPNPDDGTSVVYALRPQVAFTWGEVDFVDSAVRWRFGE
jgi:PPOX class probable F420-dependent enzyme